MKQRRLENGPQAGGLTRKIARRQVIQPRKELDPQSLHIGRVNLVIEGCFRGTSGSVCCQNGHGTIYAVGSRFCKGKVDRAQLRRDGRKLHGMGIVGWISSRFGLITS
jgi:hypothetical protein